MTAQRRRCRHHCGFCHELLFFLRRLRTLTAFKPFQQAGELKLRFCLGAVRYFKIDALGKRRAMRGHEFKIAIPVEADP